MNACLSPLPFPLACTQPPPPFFLLQVMGLMLGNFVDDYTVNCIDVFAMPQSGTSVTVEAVDPVFQHKMLEMLKQTGRPEMVVGWYVHPKRREGRV